MIAAVDLLAVYEHDALSHHPKSGWISRYGVMTAARAVSDFPRYCPRPESPGTIGVHRYKPELAVLFPTRHPLMLRCQTSPSMWTLGGDKPVIPRVAFIR